jgi:hypothetical protein
MGYEERQREFLEDNGLKLGSIVRVRERIEEMDDGWGCSWVDGMNDFIGGDFEIVDIRGFDGIGLCYTGDEDDPPYFFPYSAIETTNMFDPVMLEITNPEIKKYKLSNAELITLAGILDMCRLSQTRVEVYQCIEIILLNR